VGTRASAKRLCAVSGDRGRPLDRIRTCRLRPCQADLARGQYPKRADFRFSLIGYRPYSITRPVHRGRVATTNFHRLTRPTDTGIPPLPTCMRREHPRAATAAVQQPQLVLPSRCCTLAAHTPRALCSTADGPPRHPSPWGPAWRATRDHTPARIPVGQTLLQHGRGAGAPVTPRAPTLAGDGRPHVRCGAGARRGDGAAQQ